MNNEDYIKKKKARTYFSIFGLTIFRRSLYKGSQWGDGFYG